MVDDFDSVEDGSASKVGGPVTNPKDLETIVTLIHLAAIDLTPKPGILFSFDDLMREILALGGEECPLDPKDVRIVLQSGVPYIKRVRDRYILV